MLQLPASRKCDHALTVMLAVTASLY